MPELPEVETIKRGLERSVIGLKLLSVKTDNPKKFIGDTQNIIGTKIRNISRRAKVLIIDFDNDYSLLIHLKMTGQLIFEDLKGGRIKGGHPIPPLNLPVPNKSTHCTFKFDGGTLYFNDIRKFGWLLVTPRAEIDNLSFFIGLGPEPLTKDLNKTKLKEILIKKKNLKIKPVLMDQKVLSGIGNIYADESLFLARIHPEERIINLTDYDFEAIYSGIVKSLKTGIKHKGASDSSYVDLGGEKGVFLTYANVYHRTGMECNQCKTKIERIVVGGRGTHFCPNCQKKK